MGARCDPLEAAVVKEVLATFERNGWIAFRVNSGLIRLKGRVVRLAKKGTSDVVGVIPGPARVIAVECKRADGKGRLTEAQEAFLDDIDAEGGVSLVVADIRVLDRAIAALKARPRAEIDRLTGEEL